MKTILHTHRNSRGTALLIVMALIAVMTGAGLVYFLRNAQQERCTVGRSQAWNTSLVLAEAGIEEGLTLINNGGWPNNSTYSSDGWTVNNNVYSITRTLDPSIGSYTVYVTNFFTGPTICSVGSANGSDINLNGNVIKRAVVVHTSTTSPFPGALTLQQGVNFNGQNVTVDSYNSADPFHSYWPNYPAGLGYGVYTNTGSSPNPYRKSNGDVATDGSIVGIISIGNGQIFGFVDTGPGGTAQLGASGSVGDTSWAPNTLGIQSGFSRDDMNVAFPDVVVPSTNWTVLPNNATITNSGSYLMSQITDNMTISASNVVLYVTNGIVLNGNSTLTVASNASVTMYVGNSITDGGNGLINQTQRPSRMLIWGLPSLTSIKLNGNGAYWGAIYAPEAAVTFKGGGNSGGYYGSLTAYSIILNGNSLFSYDEALRSQLNGGQYTVTSWKEVTNN
jgi:hypothetical protein